MLPDMVRRDAACCELEFDVPHTANWGSAASLVIGLEQSVSAATFRGVGTRPQLDTGLLASSRREHAAPAQSQSWSTLGTIAQHRRFGAVRQWSSLEFEVRASAPVAVGLDGEALMLVPPLRFVSLPGALRVRVPRHSAGVSPAWGSVPLTRRNVSSCCPVPTFAAVTRVSVLRPRVAQTVAVDVASVPLLTGLDALITPSAVNEPRIHETGECSALGAMRRAVSGGSEGGAGFSRSRLLHLTPCLRIAKSSRSPSGTAMRGSAAQHSRRCPDDFRLQHAPELERGRVAT